MQAMKHTHSYFSETKDSKSVELSTAVKSKEPRLEDSKKECDHSVAAVETKACVPVVTAVETNECNPFTAKGSVAVKAEDPKTKDSAAFESSSSSLSTAMKAEDEPKPKPDGKGPPGDSGDRVGTEVYLAFEPSTPPLSQERSDELKVVENDCSGKNGQSTEEKQRKSPEKSSGYADIQYCCNDSDEDDEPYESVIESIARSTTDYLLDAGFFENCSDPKFTVDDERPENSHIHRVLSKNKYPCMLKKD